MLSPRGNPAEATAARALRDALLSMILLSAACGGDVDEGAPPAGGGGDAGAGGAGTVDYAALCPDDPTAYQPMRGRELCFATPTLGENGANVCPPADDPSVPARLSYNLRGNAVSVRSIVGSKPPKLMTASCVERAHCCELLADDAERTVCSMETGGVAAGNPCDATTSAGAPLACPTSAEAPPNDRIACCYFACGASYSVGRPLRRDDQPLVALLLRRTDWARFDDWQ